MTTILPGMSAAPGWVAGSSQLRFCPVEVMAEDYPALATLSSPSHERKRHGFRDALPVPCRASTASRRECPERAASLAVG